MEEKTKSVLSKVAVFAIALLAFLLIAGFAGDSGNGILDALAIGAFVVLVNLTVFLLGPLIFRIFPRGVGHLSREELASKNGESWLLYPPGYRKVPFGLVGVLFIVCAYIAKVRTEATRLNPASIHEEASTLVILFFTLSLGTWGLFLWTYSAFYQMNEEGFRWMAPWSRKRFVHWSDVRSVWYIPWLGKGLWVKTNKGRFRVDYDMVNASAFVNLALKHTEPAGLKYYRPWAT